MITKLLFITDILLISIQNDQKSTEEVPKYNNFLSASRVKVC